MVQPRISQSGRHRVIAKPLGRIGDAGYRSTMNTNLSKRGGFACLLMFPRTLEVTDGLRL
jgi:hypothetical protein